MNIRAQFNFRNNLPRLQNRVDRSMGRPLARAGGYVRSIMKRLIKRVSSGYPVAPRGRSAYSHGPRHLLNNSILYQVDLADHSVAVGADFDIVGLGGMFQEHGGRRRVKNKVVRPDGGLVMANFPKRSFAQPALDKALPYLPESFRNIL